MDGALCASVTTIAKQFLEHPYMQCYKEENCTNQLKDTYGDEYGEGHEYARRGSDNSKKFVF